MLDCLLSLPRRGPLSDCNVRRTDHVFAGRVPTVPCPVDRVATSPSGSDTRHSGPSTRSDQPHPLPPSSLPCEAATAPAALSRRVVVPHVVLTWLLIGRGTRAAATTATAGPARLATGPRTVTASIAARATRMPTAAALPSSRAGTRPASSRPATDSATRSPASSRPVVPRPFSIPRAGPGAAASPATSAAGEAAVAAAAASGATTAAMADGTATTTETARTLETSAAASESGTARGTATATAIGSGSATSGTASTSREPGGRRPLRCGRGRRSLHETFETAPWDSTPTGQGGVPGTARCRPAPRTRTPCLPPRRSAARSAGAEEGPRTGAVVIGTSA